MTSAERKVASERAKSDFRGIDYRLVGERESICKQRLRRKLRAEGGWDLGSNIYPKPGKRISETGKKHEELSISAAQLEAAKT